MQVLKFGGSSVANAVNISKVIAIVAKAVEKEPVVLVVSALGGVTDQLIAIGAKAAGGDESYKDQIKELEVKHLEAVRGLLPIQNQSGTLSWVKQQLNELERICDGIFLLGELSARIQDRLVSYGELLSSYIITAALKELNTHPVWTDSRQLIVTNDFYGNASVQFEKTNQRILSFIQNNSASLYVAPGFIATNEKGYTTTLGRGGSDYTGAIFAAATDATALEIWTDVTGMMTADPRLVQNPRPIEAISYEEAMELSHFGAKIIYPPTIQPVMKKNIPVWVKNTFEPDAAGTVIQQHAVANTDVVRGISSINRIALLSLEGSGMIGIPGFSKRLFEVLALNRINVILITQSSSEYSICVAINEADANAAQQAIDAFFAYEIENGKVTVSQLLPLIHSNDLKV